MLRGGNTCHTVWPLYTPSMLSEATKRNGNKMDRKDIIEVLQKTHPEATNLFKDKFGLWNVEIEDEFEIVNLAYKVEGTKLRFVGEMIVEQ
jgi:hypothetical protein